MRITFLGTGDAVGSGGRLQTCLYVTSASDRLLVDCGATATIAMKRFGVDPGSIDAIVLTHLHGDHFAGLPFFLIESRYVTKRSRPLVIAGPPGVEARVRAAMDLLFPGAAEGAVGFDMRFVELLEGRSLKLDGAEVEAFPASHPSGAPSYSLRVSLGGRTLAVSGDTQWTDVLPQVARDADLFVCECYAFDKRVPYHLDYPTLRDRRHELRCRRMLLTHMSDEMLARRAELEIETADDGMVVEL